MDQKSKQSKRRNVISSLDVIIQGLNIAENLATITPAKAVFSTVSVILTMIRASVPFLCEDPSQADRIWVVQDSMINEEDYVDLGLACNAICTTLDQGLNGKRLSELSDSLVDTISQLTT